MAKYERTIRGDFAEVLQTCEHTILQRSISASFEDGSDFMHAGVRVAVRVYERYSAFGGNRVSLNLTLVGGEDRVFLSAITAGGSQATFFKLNTVGEEAFLDTLQGVLEQRYPR